jgi:hypothetical protein
MAANVFVVGNDKVQYGRKVKNVSGTMDIMFPQPFSGNPTVVVTSFWEGGSQVGHAETITNVDNTKFTVNSGNTAPNYFVSWIAMGPP